MPLPLFVKGEKKMLNIKINLPGLPNIICDDITKLTREEWLAVRKNANGGYSIGGSNAASIMGEGYESLLDVYNRILDIPMEQRVMPQLQLDLGHFYERQIAEKFAEQNNYTLIDTEEMYQHATFPWMIADFDYLCVDNKTGKIKGLEIKHTDPMNFDFQDQMKAGEPPIKYVWQVRHYMAIAQLDEWIICLGWKRGNVATEITDIAFTSVMRDLAVENCMIEEQRLFLENTRNGIRPSMIGTDVDQALDAMKRAFGAGNGAELVFTDPKIAELMEQLWFANENSKLAAKKAKEAEDVTKRLSVAIREKMHNASTAEAVANDVLYSVKIKTQNKTKVDEEEVKLTYPALFEECRLFDSAVFRKNYAKEFKGLQQIWVAASDMLVVTSKKVGGAT